MLAYPVFHDLDQVQPLFKGTFQKVEVDLVGIHVQKAQGSHVVVGGEVFPGDHFFELFKHNLELAAVLDEKEGLHQVVVPLQEKDRVQVDHGRLFIEQVDPFAGVFIRRQEVLDQEAVPKVRLVKPELFPEAELVDLVYRQVALKIGGHIAVVGVVAHIPHLEHHAVQL